MPLRLPALTRGTAGARADRVTVSTQGGEGADHLTLATAVTQGHTALEAGAVAHTAGLTIAHIVGVGAEEDHTQVIPPTLHAAEQTRHTAVGAYHIQGDDALEATPVQSLT